MLKSKISSFLKDLNDEELGEIYTLLKEKNQINDMTIKEITRRNDNKRKICVVCGKPLSDNYFELIFGDISFRRKATFCEKDCIIYFLNMMDDKNEQKEIRTKNQDNEDKIEKHNTEFNNNQRIIRITRKNNMKKNTKARDHIHNETNNKLNPKKQKQESTQKEQRNKKTSLNLLNKMIKIFY